MKKNKKAKRRWRRPRLLIFQSRQGRDGHLYRSFFFWPPPPPHVCPRASPLVGKTRPSPAFLCDAPPPRTPRPAAAHRVVVMAVCIMTNTLLSHVTRGIRGNREAMQTAPTPTPATSVLERCTASPFVMPSSHHVVPSSSLLLTHVCA